MPEPTTQQPVGNRPARQPETRCTDQDAEPMGGDPPCWAHLFEDEDELRPTAQQPERH